MASVREMLFFDNKKRFFRPSPDFEAFCLEIFGRIREKADALGYIPDGVVRDSISELKPAEAAWVLDWLQNNGYIRNVQFGQKVI